MTADRPAPAAAGRLPIGDASFPVDPLAGQGVKQVLRSTELALSCIGDPEQDPHDYNLHASEMARRHHEQRCEIYGSSRWFTREQGYWWRQARLSETAAAAAPE